MICLTCGNFTYFEIEVEGLKAIETSNAGVVVDDAIIDDWNYSDEVVRDNLHDILTYSLKNQEQAIQYNSQDGRYEHAYISCARCCSHQVCLPYSAWHPPTPNRSLAEELNEHRHEYLSLRKERAYENNMQWM